MYRYRIKAIISDRGQARIQNGEVLDLFANLL